MALPFPSCYHLRSGRHGQHPSGGPSRGPRKPSRRPSTARCRGPPPTGRGWTVRQSAGSPQWPRSHGHDRSAGANRRIRCRIGASWLAAALPGFDVGPVCFSSARGGGGQWREREARAVHQGPQGMACSWAGRSRKPKARTAFFKRVFAEARELIRIESIRRR